MKRNKKFIEILSEEIYDELKKIEELKKELKEIPENSIFSNRAKGSIFHDFYNRCERIFKKIATEIDGYFPASPSWDKELLYRMTRKVNKLRPEVISEELASELDDYLSFRHIFRNIYGFELKGERIKRLEEKFYKVANTFQKEIKNFLKNLSGK